MAEHIIASHEFPNKSKIVLTFDHGDYGTIGEVSSFSVFMLEYNDGPYFENGKEVCHYMVTNTVYFPLTSFPEAVRRYKQYIDYFTAALSGDFISAGEQAKLWRKTKTEPSMRLEDIKSFHDSLLDLKGEPVLPGAQIEFSSIHSSGRCQNHYGVGTTDISLHRPESKWPWVDLVDIRYAAPTQEMILDAQTKPGSFNSEFSGIMRRVSFKQARKIQEVIVKALEAEFKGVIPADDEL